MIRVAVVIYWYVDWVYDDVCFMYIETILVVIVVCFFFNDTATTEIYTRSLVGSVRCV